VSICEWDDDQSEIFNPSHSQYLILLILRMTS
jgi:hypothetical protein